MLRLLGNAGCFLSRPKGNVATDPQRQATAIHSSKSVESQRAFTFLFFLIALLSEIVGTVAGFGSSVFFVSAGRILF